MPMSRSIPLARGLIEGSMAPGIHGVRRRFCLVTVPFACLPVKLLISGKVRCLVIPKKQMSQRIFERLSGELEKSQVPSGILT